MGYVPSGGLALIKGRNGRSQAPYAASGALVGRVIAVHRDTYTVDLAMGTGELLRRIKVATPNIGTRAGTAYLQSISNHITTTNPDGPLGDFSDDQARSVYALVHFIADDPNNPVVTGFLHPHTSQMTFDRPGFCIERHESDLYSHTENGAASTYDAATDTTIPNFEWFHPSGAFFRAGQGTTHADLTGQDAQGRAQFRGTANANAAMGTAGPHSADFVPVTLKHPSGSGVTLDNSGNVLVQSPGQATLNAHRLLTVADEAIASGLVTFDSQGYPIIGAAAPAGVPAVAIGSAGTGATATVDSWSTNVFGHVTSTAGTGGATIGAVIHTVTLASSALMPTNAHVLVWGAFGFICIGQSTTGFTTMLTAGTPSAGAGLSFYYLIVRSA